MHLHRLRTITPVLVALGTALVALAAPTSAHAIMAGAESNGLLVNSTATPAIQKAELDRMKSQGVQVVRVNFGWSEIAAGCANATPAQLTDHLNGCYNWSVIDSFVKLAGENKMRIVLSTSRVPQWINPAGCAQDGLLCFYMGKTQAEFNKVHQAYAAFMRAAGTRYKNGSPYGTVQYWTIWNEPNADTFWKPMPNAARYAQLYGAAAQALKAVYPAAKVAPGPTGPKGKYEPNRSLAFVRPANFIAAFQAHLPKFLPKSNPRRFIDAWAHNPYPLVLAAQPSAKLPTIKKPVIGMSNIEDLFQILDSKPITRKLPVWATEFGWETRPHEVNRNLSVPMAMQAQYVGEAYDRLDRTGRVTIGIWYGVTDGPLRQDPNYDFAMTADWQSGTFTMEGVAKPSFKMFQRMISVPKGSVRKGAMVDVWGKSNLAPSKGRVVVCTKLCLTKAAVWAYVPGVKRKSTGEMMARYKVTQAKTYFAVYDAQKQLGGDGYGMTRLVTAR